jgi:hypothetical protein
VSNVLGEAVIVIGADTGDLTKEIGNGLTDAAEKAGDEASGTLAKALASGLGKMSSTIGSGLSSALSAATGNGRGASDLEAMGRAASHAGDGFQDLERHAHDAGEASDGIMGKFDKYREKFDSAEMIVTGFRDTITGVQDFSSGVTALFADSATLAQNVATAQQAYDAAVKQFGENSKQAADAQNQLSIAQEQQARAQGSLADKVLLTATGLGDLASSAANFLVPVIAGAAGLKELGVQSIFATVQTTAQAAAQKVAAAATWVWNGAQAALNAVMEANPIAIVILAIAALVAAVVIAYKNSETFRNIVNAAWAAVRDTIAGVANWITGTVVPWLVNAWNAISTGAQQLLAKMQPVFSTINTVIQATGTVISWLWTNIVQPTFNFIAAAAQTIFMAQLKVAFLAVQTAIQVLGPVFTWLYTNAVKPAFDFIVAVVKADWALIKAVWDVITTALQTLGGWFTTLYTKYIKPAWDQISTVIQAGWNSAIKPAFDALTKGVQGLGSIFSTAVGAIGKAWDGLKAVASAPIRFVLQTVLNDGLIRGFNFLSSHVGGPSIPNVPVPFAAGGVLPGYTPGRDVHTFTSPTGGRLDLSGGEAVMRPEFTRAVGGRRGVSMLNEMAKRGALNAAFASGGIIPDIGNWIKNQASGALSWASDKASSIWKALSDPMGYIKGLMPSIPGGGAFPQMAQGAATKLLGLAVEKIKGLFSAFQKAYETTLGPGAALSGGAAAQWAALHARFPDAQLFSATRPGAITSTGNTSYHALGRAIDVSPRNDIFDWIRATYGRNIKELIFSPRGNEQIKNGSPYFYQEPVRGDHWDHVHWAMRNGGVIGRPLVFDRGGVLPTGMSVVQNNTGAPEPLSPYGGDIYVTISIDDLAKMRTLDDFLALLDNARVNGRKTQRSGRTSA